MDAHPFKNLGDLGRLRNPLPSGRRSGKYRFLYRIFLRAIGMGHVSFTELRQNMASYFDRVVADREPLVVTRQGGKGNLVVMSEEEFAGWQETVHLLSSPRNAARLAASIQQIRDGSAGERDLIPGTAPAAG